MPTIKPTSEHNLSMSGKIGDIKCDYQYLVDVLGIPQDEDGDSKSQVNWYFKLTHNGKVFKISIYDYKQYKSLDKIKSWSIGGFNVEAVEGVKELLPNAKVTKFTI